MAELNRRQFEFAVLVVIISALAVFMLSALERAGVEVEEAAVQTEVAAIRIELLDRIAHRELVGGDLPKSDNPMQWIARVPEAYLGELDSTPEARGVWYFDRKAGELAYRFRGSGEARFRLLRGGGGGAPGVLAGVGLLRLENVK